LGEGSGTGRPQAVAGQTAEKLLQADEKLTLRTRAQVAAEEKLAKAIRELRALRGHVGRGQLSRQTKASSVSGKAGAKTASESTTHAEKWQGTVRAKTVERNEMRTGLEEAEGRITALEAQISLLQALAEKERTLKEE
jgi:hypothetical protein